MWKVYVFHLTNLNLLMISLIEFFYEIEHFKMNCSFIYFHTRPKVAEVSVLVSQFCMFFSSDRAETFSVGFSYLVNTKMTIDKKVCESVTQN